MSDDSRPMPRLADEAEEAAPAAFPPVPTITDERTAAWMAHTARLQLAQHRAREAWHREQAQYWAEVLQVATGGDGARTEAATAAGRAESDAASSVVDQWRHPIASAVDGDIRITTTQQQPPSRDTAMGMRRSDESATSNSLSASKLIAQSPSRGEEAEPGRAVEGAADGALYPILSSPMRRDGEISQQQEQAFERFERRASWESQSRGASPLPRAPMPASSSSSSSSSSFTSRAPPLQHLTLSRPSISRQKGPDSAGLAKGSGGSSKRTKPHGGRGILASWFGFTKRKAEVSGPFNVRKMSTGASVSNVAAAARASSFHASSEGGSADAPAQESIREYSRASASPQQTSTKQSPAPEQQQKQQQQYQQQQLLPPVALAPPGKRLSLGQLLNAAQASPNSRSSSAHNSPESTSSNESSNAYAMQSQHQQQQPQYQPQAQQSTQPPSLLKPRSLPPTPYVSISAPSSRSASPLRILPGEAAARQAARDAAAQQLAPPAQVGRAFSPTLPPHLGTDGSSSAPDASLAGKKHNWPPGPPPLLSQLSQQQYPSGSASPSAPLQSPPSLPSTAPASPFSTEMSGVSIGMRQSSPPPLPPFAGARAPVQTRSQSQPSSPVLSEAQAASARRALFEQSISGAAAGTFAQGQQLQMGLEAAAQFQRRKEKAGSQQPNANAAPLGASGPPPIPPPKPAALEKMLTQQQQQRPPLHHYHAHASAPSGTNQQPGIGAPGQWDKEDKSALVGSAKSGGSAAFNMDDPSTALKFERMRTIPPPPPPTRPQRDLA